MFGFFDDLCLRVVLTFSPFSLIRPDFFQNFVFDFQVELRVHKAIEGEEFEDLEQHGYEGSRTGYNDGEDKYNEVFNA